MIWHLLFITELCLHRYDGPFPTALVNFTKLSMIVRLTHKLARRSTIRIRIGSLRFNFKVTTVLVTSRSRACAFCSSLIVMVYGIGTLMIVVKD